ncbi:hypothetical protein [Thermococcus sp. AM4]|uniref:hypothetical protein n=1 Tax=Thermococcus sp. (strain AM4) TaxID=246969 RepID=UPI00064F6B86|nr:hypothetical protein [Thermococcus sp. AM4]
MVDCPSPEKESENLFYGVLLIGFIFMWWAMYSLPETSGIDGIISTFFPYSPAFAIPVGFYYLSVSNPQLLIPCLKEWGVKTETELEKLELAHKKALEYTENAFKYSLEGWIYSGLVLAFAEIALWKGWLHLVTPNLIALLLVSLFGTIDFVFIIVFYLRKRSIEKALFAIQLKKSDKAEISIKI